MDRFMEAWVAGLFRGVSYTVFGAAICGGSAWVAFRVGGWKRLLAVICACLGIALVFNGLGVFAGGFYDPLRRR
jgi:sulfite exporter TauE/SafE